MATLTVNIVGVGQKDNSGSPSTAGHMWIEINDGSGTKSYGYYPSDANKVSAYGSGDVRSNDNVRYPVRDYSKTIPISDSQLKAIQSYVDKVQSNPGTYNAATSSCVDFVPLLAAGLNCLRASNSGNLHTDGRDVISQQEYIPIDWRK